MVMHRCHAGIVIAMTRCEEHARPDGLGGGTNNRVLAIRLSAPAGADRAAFVEKCGVFMHQSMGMELVAIGVTTDPDTDVPLCAVAIRAVSRFRKPNRHEAVSTVSVGQRLRRP